jgi:hypothetical protein
MWRVLETGVVHTAFLVGRPEGKTPLERPGVDGRIILKWVFNKWGGGEWTGLIWLRIRTGGGHL